MRYNVLGSLEVRTDAGEPGLPKGRKQRLLLASLLLHAPRVASVDRLIDILWGDDLPDDPTAALQTQVSRLRSFFREAGDGAEPLESEPYGYRLAVDADRIDAGRFENAVAEARCLESPAAALDRLDEALAHWRGRPYEEFADLLPFQGTVTRLEELRTSAREWRVEILLGLGRTADAVAAAEPLVREDPLRERPRALLMETLYQTGRQSDALAVFQDYRRLLSEELGLDPSPALRRLELEILRHERPSPAPPAPASEPVSDPAETPNPAATAVSEDPASAAPALVLEPIPLPLTDLVGRTAEVEAVRGLLESNGLVTLTGAGGTGKTRLALEVVTRAREDLGGAVAWVRLEALSEPELVAQEVAGVLGIREQPGRPASDALLEVLRNRRLLLALDNCEHLVDACAALAETLLRGCPGITLLATSREPLGLAGEVVWAVPALTVPDTDGAEPDALGGFDAVRLFVDRARAAEPGFDLDADNAAAVAQICRRLDGVPLAIELAAARLRALTPAQIARRLDDGMALLTTGSRTALPRHRTLRAAIEWSWDLLDDAERRLLERLSVFAGEFGLDAVETVCFGSEADRADPADAEDRTAPLDLLSSLVDKSLVAVRRWGGTARYRLLETVRQYARERLAERDGGVVLRRRHAEFYAALVERAEPDLLGARRGEVGRRLARDQDDIRAALAWALAEPQAVPTAFRLAGSLYWFWHYVGHIGEGRRWLDETLERASPDVPDGLRARVLHGAAMAAFSSGDGAAARPLVDEGLRIARGLDDARILMFVLSVHAWVLRDAGDMEAATSAADECLEVARRGRLRPTDVAFAHWIRAGVHFTAGSLDTAREAQREAGAIWRATGNAWGLSQVLHGLAMLALRDDDAADAARLCREAIEVIRDQADVYWTCRALEGLASALTHLREPERAARLLGAAEALRESIGVPVLAFERPRYDATVSALRAALDADRIAGPWAEGRRMSLDRAVEYALDPDA